MPTYIFDRTKGCMVDKATREPIEMPKEFVAPRIYLAPDYKAYSCPITGKPVEGRRAHQENLKRHGCRVLEKGETQQAQRNAAESDRKLEKLVERAVETTAAQIDA